MIDARKSSGAESALNDGSVAGGNGPPPCSMDIAHDLEECQFRGMVRANQGEFAVMDPMKEASDIARPFKEIGDAIPGTPVAPAHGIAAIALSMAMKFHDIATIKDGAMYQQYKLEGRNMRELHLDMVFETALSIERHLMASSERIANIIVDALEIELKDEPDGSVATLPTA